MQNPIQNEKFLAGLVIYAIAIILLASTYLLPNKEVVFFINFFLFWIYRMIIWEGRWKFPDRNQNIASGLVFNLYESFYLIHLYPFSIIASFFFLISLHSFIPIWWLVFLGKLTFPYFNKDSRYLYPLIAGLLIPIFIAIGYIGQWHSINQQIKTVANQSATNQKEADLPRWVALSQKIEDGWMSQKILKAGIVYTTGNINSEQFTPRFGRINERKKHDPFQCCF